MGRVDLATVDSPIGELTVAARGSKVCLVHFGPESEKVRAALNAWYPDHAIEPAADPAGVVAVLERYFAGDMASLDEIDVELHGTDFQQRVWHALRSVAAGTTSSYAELARKVGSPCGGARRRRCQRRQPRCGRPAVPPHHRQQRHAHRLRRRSRSQALAAATTRA